MWEQLVAELAPHGLAAVAVSLDDDPEAARPWLDEANLSFPSVVDSHMLTAERFGIVNVPTAVWFAESGEMVRPPTIAPADDRFREFSGIDSSVHHDALRAWVVDDAAPDPGLMTRWRQPAADDQARARAHRRIGSHLHAIGDGEGMAEHFAAAAQLAPNDWTIQRGTLPLAGDDPFGEKFFAFAGEWNEAGAQSYSE